MRITIDIKGIYKDLYLPIMSGYCSVGKCFRRQSNYLYFFLKANIPYRLQVNALKKAWLKKIKINFKKSESVIVEV